MSAAAILILVLAPLAAQEEPDEFGQADRSVRQKEQQLRELQDSIDRAIRNNDPELAEELQTRWRIEEANLETLRRRRSGLEEELALSGVPFAHDPSLGPVKIKLGATYSLFDTAIDAEDEVGVDARIDLHLAGNLYFLVSLRFTETEGTTNPSEDVSVTMYLVGASYVHVLDYGHVFAVELSAALGGASFGSDESTRSGGSDPAASVQASLGIQVVEGMRIHFGASMDVAYSNFRNDRELLVSPSAHLTAEYSF